MPTVVVLIVERWAGHRWARQVVGRASHSWKMDRAVGLFSKTPCLGIRVLAMQWNRRDGVSNVVRSASIKHEEWIVACGLKCYPVVCIRDRKNSSASLCFTSESLCVYGEHVGEHSICTSSQAIRVKQLFRHTCDGLVTTVTDDLLCTAMSKNMNGAASAAGVAGAAAVFTWCKRWSMHTMTHRLSSEQCRKGHRRGWCPLIQK